MPTTTPADAYSNTLLMELLSGKYQAWLVFDDMRTVHGVGVTCVVMDDLSQSNQLVILAFKALIPISDEVAHETVRLLIEYAVSQGCRSLEAFSSNERAIRLLTLVGFQKKREEYVLEIC